MPVPEHIPVVVPVGVDAVAAAVAVVRNSRVIARIAGAAPGIPSVVASRASKDEESATNEKKHREPLEFHTSSTLLVSMLLAMS